MKKGLCHSFFLIIKYALRNITFYIGRNDFHKFFILSHANHTFWRKTSTYRIRGLDPLYNPDRDLLGVDLIL